MQEDAREQDTFQFGPLSRVVLSWLQALMKRVGKKSRVATVAALVATGHSRCRAASLRGPSFLSRDGFPGFIIAVYHLVESSEGHHGQTDRQTHRQTTRREGGRRGPMHGAGRKMGGRR